jgi:hypothetical protein
MKTFITGSRERKPPVVARTERRKAPRNEPQLRMAAVSPGLHRGIR